MSVRKSAARSSAREMSGGAQAMKSLGIWALLAVASFVVGLFILSPLINAAAGSHSNPQPNTTVNAPRPSSQPAPGPAASSIAPAEKPERRADSEVGISVDKPKPAERSEVQKPLTVDSSAPSQDSATAATGDEHRTRRRRDTDPGAGEQGTTNPAGRSTDESTSDTTARGDRRSTEQPADSIDRSTTDRSTESTDENQTRRGRRTRRDRATDEPSPSRDKSNPPTDVQKSDSIDR
jgi:hypothetical protein